MAPRESNDPDTAQRLLAARNGLRDGSIKVPPDLQGLANQIIAAPLTPLGLVNEASLSAEALSFGRMVGMTTQFKLREPAQDESKRKPMADLQEELFALYAQLFAALTGRGADYVGNDTEIKERMLFRLREEPETLRDAANAAAEALASFYREHAVAIFSHASRLGGMRLVSGGQRTFGPSALTAVRVTGLYADTHLIPDPIHPYLIGELHLNARHLQLAIALHNILQLRPLVDARLPVPPVFVFPSFEEPLEEGDAHTKLGIEQLALSVLGPVCDGDVSSLEDLFDYARKREDTLIEAILRERLFVPPGADPDRRWDRAEAIKAYIDGLEGIRSAEMLGQLRAAPPGVILLNGVLERLRPHYHLLENANELRAQPLLSQKAHWHYFEKCAAASARELHEKKRISDQALGTLHAFQDDSLSWLANISVQDLTTLIANNEHKWLRAELDKYTSQLSGESADPDEMLREVNHGLASLLQRQQQAMSEIERKYAPKRNTTYVTTAVGVGLAATAYMLPILSPLLGVAAPVAAGLAAVGAGAMGLTKEKIAEAAEKQQLRRSMLGMLATARARDPA